MDTISPSQDLNNLYEAILDSKRLALSVYLSLREYSVLELARIADMKPKDIQRHLEVLECARLVNVLDRGGKKGYRFNPGHLEQTIRQQFARPKKDANQSSFDLPNDQKMILAQHTHNDGSLKMIPSKSKKIVVILEYVCRSFENDADYSKGQVNNILPDTITPRRYLVDYGYLGRESNGARYWRINPQKSAARNS